MQYYVPQIMNPNSFKKVTIREIEEKLFPVVIRARSIDEIYCSSENFATDFKEEKIMQNSFELRENDLLTICEEYKVKINIYFPLISNNTLTLWIFSGRLFYPNLRVKGYWELLVSELFKIRRGNVILFKNFGVEVLFQSGKIWMAPFDMHNYV